MYLTLIIISGILKPTFNSGFKCFSVIPLPPYSSPARSGAKGRRNSKRPPGWAAFCLKGKLFFNRGG